MPGKKQPADILSRLEEKEDIAEKEEEEENWDQAANRDKMRNTPEVSEEVQAFRSNSLEAEVFYQEEFSTKENLKKQQRRDPFFGNIISALEGKEDPDAKVIRALKYFCLKDDILFRKQKHHELGEIFLLCIPKSLVNQFFEGIHHNPMSAHSGFTKAYRTALRKYYFPGMKTFLRYKISHCQDCQKFKKQPLKLQSELLHVPVGQIAESFVLDTMGPITINGVTRWLHVAVESATRYLIVKIVDKMNADTICQFIEQELILRFGPCKYIHLDNHPVHNSKQLLELSKKYNFELKKSPSFYHNSSGLAEIYQRIIQQSLKPYVYNKCEQWIRVLPFIIFAINNTVQTNAKHSPHFLLYGYDAKNLTDSTLGASSDVQVSRTKLNDIRESVKKLLQKENARQKKYFDKRHRQTEYKAGDQVLVYFPNRTVGTPEMWTKCYKGPCTILQKLNPNLYLVEMPDTFRQKIQRISVDRLRFFFKDDTMEKDQPHL
jgi:hypothetical protein